MSDNEPLNPSSPETPENQPLDPVAVEPSDTAGEERAYPSIFDKPDHSREKQAKNRRISRGGRNVLLTLLLCVALAGSVFAIYRFLPKEEGDNTSSSGSVLSLFDYTQYVTYDSSLTETEGVKNIQVANPEGSFEIVYSIVEKTQQNSATGEEETGPAIEWSVSGYDGVTFDSDTLQYLVGDLLKVIYSSVYTPDADSANADGITYRQECGLDSPMATLTANFNDGKSYTIYIGDEIPIGGSYYLMQEGDNAIYITKSSDVDYFLRGISYFVSKQMVPMLESTKVDDSYFTSDVLSRFDKITVSGSSFSTPIVFEMADSSDIAVPTDYRMTSPEKRSADTDMVTTLLSPLANGLEANECLVMQATQSDLKQYGLDDPICQVSYVVEGKTYVLKVGSLVEEGYYAASFSGSDSIFRVAQSSVSFAFKSAKDYRSILLYVTNITDVSSIQIDAVNESGNLISETFTLHHMTSETESGTTNSLTVYDAQDNLINEDDFRELYQGIISMTAASWADDGKQAKTPKLTITLNYTDGSSSDVIRLSEYSSRRYYYTLNGKGDAIVLSSTVDTLLGQFSSLLSAGN